MNGHTNFWKRKSRSRKERPKLLKEIENDSAADNIGITVTLEAEGPVINPAVLSCRSGEFIKIGNEVRSFSINAGDVVIITTENK